MLTIYFTAICSCLAVHACRISFAFPFSLLPLEHLQGFLSICLQLAHIRCFFFSFIFYWMDCFQGLCAEKDAIHIIRCANMLLDQISKLFCLAFWDYLPHVSYRNFYLLVYTNLSRHTDLFTFADFIKVVCLFMSNLPYICVYPFI